jgi:hypothetical protein
VIRVAPARRWSAAFALGVAGCAADAVVPGATTTATGFAIAPYEVHEECARVVPGDRLDYRFEAKSPVSFQIYYQEGVMFIAPVSRDDVTEFGGVFQVPDARRYCLRWEAGREGALLDYRIRLLRASTAP